jgi:lipopolysaccharide biosynthesis regulator YciM
VAFVVVGVAAWLLGRRAGRARTVRLPRDYYIGLDHLINDRFDRAAEVFARVALSDGDAAEIQFALGSLFRRRGEVDRAIAVHTRLKERGGPGVREQAGFALALDFYSAGLMDRAERLFEELAASGEYRRDALEHLLRIHEQQGDWADALKTLRELPAELQSERRQVAAHYLCELAEHALVQGDTERARTLLKQAREHDAQLPRAQLLAARMLEAAGERSAALELYVQALEATPALTLEIVPRVLRLAQPDEVQRLLEAAGERLQRSGRATSRQLAWLLAMALAGDEAQPSAGAVSDLLLPGASAEPSALGSLLARIGAAGGRYQCEECGLGSVVWYWRCPKCRAWDSMRPAVFKWAERGDEVAQG